MFWKAWDMMQWRADCVNRSLLLHLRYSWLLHFSRISPASQTTLISLTAAPSLSFLNHLLGVWFEVSGWALFMTHALLLQSWMKRWHGICLTEGSQGNRWCELGVWRSQTPRDKPWPAEARDGREQADTFLLLSFLWTTLRCVFCGALQRKGYVL